MTAASRTADIAAGRIDIVVVYKVDRLTRALSDFARIVVVQQSNQRHFCHTELKISQRDGLES